MSAMAAALAMPAVAAGQEAAPFCGPEIPKAVQFFSLPDRIEYGPAEYFSWEERFPGNWELSGDLHVQYFYDGEIDLDRTVPVDREMYVGIPLHAEEVRIRATYVQKDWDTEVTCMNTVEKTVTAYRRFGVAARCAAPVYRPRKIIIACGDGNFGLKGLRWRNWNKALANGKGQVYANDCRPNCASGRFRYAKARVRAWRPRLGNDLDVGYYYSRMRIKWAGRSETFKLGEDEAGWYWR
jgi:hypothetical protein